MVMATSDYGDDYHRLKGDMNGEQNVWQIRNETHKHIYCFSGSDDDALASETIASANRQHHWPLTFDKRLIN